MIIGRGRHREHPNQHCLLLLRVLHNFRLHTPKGTPKGVKWPSVTSVAMVLLQRKKGGKKPGMRRTYFRSGPFPDRASSSHVTDVTSGQKALLGRIWRHFLLRVRRSYFRTGHLTDVTSGHVIDVTSSHVTSGHVTSGQVTSGCTPSQHLSNANWAVPIYYWRDSQNNDAVKVGSGHVFA
jgi:hypothetical protein